MLQRLIPSSKRNSTNKRACNVAPRLSPWITRRLARIGQATIRAACYCMSSSKVVHRRVASTQVLEGTTHLLLRQESWRRAKSWHSCKSSFKTWICWQRRLLKLLISSKASRQTWTTSQSTWTNTRTARKRYMRWRIFSMRSWPLLSMKRLLSSITAHAGGNHRPNPEVYINFNFLKISNL